MSRCGTGGRAGLDPGVERVGRMAWPIGREVGGTRVLRQESAREGETGFSALTR